MATELYWDESGILTHYIADRLEINMDPREGGFIFFDKGKMIGAVRLYDQRGEGDCKQGTIMGVAESPRWFTRNTIRDVATMFFAPPPYGLGLYRLNSFINIDNKHSISVTKRIGFTEEGLLRGASAGRKDVMVLGMLREECPWIGQEVYLQEDDQSETPVKNSGNS